MIRFNQSITVERNRNEQWQITTDRGDRYLMHEMAQTSEKSIISDYVKLNHTTEFRLWQIDLFVKETTRRGRGDDFILWLVYKQGQGHNQAHDIVIMYHKLLEMWILSTSECHWFEFAKLNDIIFMRKDAVQADVLKQEDRQQILYPILAELNRCYIM